MQAEPPSITVSPSGLVISIHHPCIATSPGGLVNDPSSSDPSDLQNTVLVYTVWKHNREPLWKSLLNLVSQATQMFLNPLATKRACANNCQ